MVTWKELCTVQIYTYIGILPYNLCAKYTSRYFGCVECKNESSEKFHTEVIDRLALKLASRKTKYTLHTCLRIVCAMFRISLVLLVGNCSSSIIEDG